MLSNFFVPNIYIAEDGWLKNTSMARTVQKTQIKKNMVLTPPVVNPSCTDQNIVTNSTKITGNNNHDVEVPIAHTTLRDTIATNYHQTEQNEFDILVQKVHGESPKNLEDIFMDSTSDTDMVDSEDENSVGYIAEHVEKVDLLDFDDSDVSIVDEDYDVVF